MGDGVQSSTYKYDEYISRALASSHGRQRMMLTVVRTTILKVSSEAGEIAAWGVMVGLNQLWSKLFRQLSAVIHSLGESMASNDPASIVETIVSLIACELFLFIPTWRVHAYGFAAYIKSRGGVKKLNLHGSALNAIGQAFRIVALANSSSSTRHQITALNDWTRADANAAFAHTGHPLHPCPTVLFYEMMSITNMRVSCANNVDLKDLRPEARRVAENIRAFDPDNWQEQYPCVGELYSLFGRMFQTATTLYAILSLPSSLSVEFLPPKEQNGKQSIAACRIGYRARLLQLIAEAGPIVTTKRALVWATAVLGVASFDGADEREFTRAVLIETRKEKSSRGTETVLLRVLEEFWAAGGKTWEECFYGSMSVY
ncbi:hypothetical protein NLG97_g1734 [Lecanicillium saksenae]|uniref:Uncharacterized protein n=1 Tax=Lecanicillium saksenae TaxID=468837 RepID=A0ACC1R692_9HYPO|nr:hypothetical protein NLG97_g1734 [Lecanicillium saksenae]